MAQNTCMDGSESPQEEVRGAPHPLSPSPTPVPPKQWGGGGQGFDFILFLLHLLLPSCQYF